jgi:ATP-dependent DNA helicase RecQ
MQVRAGYVLGSIRASLKAKTELWRDLLVPLTAFELKGVEEEVMIEHSLLAVADNIISRGMPTLPSLRVERAIAESTGLTQLHEVKGSISYSFTNELTNADKRVMMYALCPIHPILRTRDVIEDRADTLGSPAEEAFFGQALPSLVGEWAAQVVESQRPLDTIIPSTQAHKFKRQQVDFAVELPLMAKRKQGLVVEIDGQLHHNEIGQRKLDGKRDGSCRRAGWQYARIEARDAACPPMCQERCRFG